MWRSCFCAPFLLWLTLASVFRIQFRIGDSLILFRKFGFSAILIHNKIYFTWGHKWTFPICLIKRFIDLLQSDIVHCCAIGIRVCSFQLMHFVFCWNAACRQVASKPPLIKYEERLWEFSVLQYVIHHLQPSYLSGSFALLWRIVSFSGSFALFYLLDFRKCHTAVTCW